MSYEGQIGKIRLIPQFQISFLHEFANDSRNIEAHLTEGGAPFSVRTDSPDRDFVTFSTGLDVGLTNNMVFSIAYQTEAGRDNFTSHSINGTINIQF